MTNLCGACCLYLSFHRAGSVAQDYFELSGVTTSRSPDVRIRGSPGLRAKLLLFISREVFLSH